jgi:PAS domain S-box-containing protein
LPIITKSGKIRIVSISASVVELGKQRIVQGVFRDITERKYMENLLQSKSKEQQIILDSTPAMIFFKDRENRFLHVNKAFEEGTGILKKDLEGKSMFEIFSKEEADAYWRDDLEVIKSGKAKRGIVETMQTPLGKRIVQTDKIPYFDEQGKVKGVIGFVIDITERKKAEDALINAARIKSEFTNMVSHELRTPLTALKESISQVSEGMLGSLTDDQKRILDISKRNVDRLARLIGEILDFHALETGRITFKKTDNNINDLVKETRDMMEIITREKGVDFILKLDPDLPLIRCDRDKINQVLSNLVNNSIKFTEKGSIIISTEKKENVIQVSIKDTGTGIKAEDMPRLFQRYEQLERTTGGTGLGLAISLEIIKSHGGKIWVDSVYGEGTTVTFTLPIHERRS